MSQSDKYNQNEAFSLSLVNNEFVRTCKDGPATFSVNCDQEEEARRLRCHTVSSQPTAGPRCHICDRICASDFGLRSHLRIHNRPSSAS